MAETTQERVGAGDEQAGPGVPAPGRRVASTPPAREPDMAGMSVPDEHDEIIGVLAPDGTLRAGQCVEEPVALLHEMYRWMVFGRALDTRFLNLQRQGRLTTYAPVSGQEAVQVACGLALQRDDWLVPTYRDSLVCSVFGVPPENILYTWSGHPTAGRIPPGVNALPFQVGIAEQIPHAVGIAWGMKLRGASAAALVTFGDGATSEGAFHEGCNFAGVLKAPVVLVCQNNGWAISVPRSQQTASATLAQKGAAYGIPGIVVDGNDVLAVYRVVGAALARARSGGGPTLIEAQTYRLGPHTTSDDPTRYRSAEELAPWQHERDPLIRLHSYLERNELWDSARQAALEEETRERVARIVSAATSAPPPAPEAMFDHVYENAPARLQAQRTELLSHLRDNTTETKHG